MKYNNLPKLMHESTPPIKRLSVVLSFRNEQEVIPELVSRLRKSCQSAVQSSYELVFVNDRSTDNSLGILRAEQKKAGDLIIVNMSRCFGVSECVMAGLECCSGEYVVYMDADLQDPPELIPELMKKAREEQAEVVYTTRRSRSGEAFSKLLVTRIGYWILRKTSDINIPYNSGDFKLLSRRVVKHVLELKEQKPFMRGLVSWVGFKQVQFFYDRQPRAGGKTHFPTFSFKILNIFLESALISFSDVPLKLCLVLGFLIMSGSGLLMIHVLIQKFTGQAVPGWAALISVILLMGGAQIMITGILALYIHSIYLEAKRRPLYIVEEVIYPE